MTDYKVGYTTGVFDLFHVGHLNIIKRAREMCDFLIVGVTTDELVSYKDARVVIPYNERLQIIESIKYVDKAVPQKTMDKMEAWRKFQFDVMFVGSDWQGTERWNAYEKEFLEVGVDIIYFPYTTGTSSTRLREALCKLVGDVVASF